MEALRQGKDNYKVVAVQDEAELHYDSHRDSATEGWIESEEEDMVDSNVADTDDEEGDVHDCGVVGCNDSQEQSVDTGLHEDLAEQRELHVLRSLRRDTCLSEDVYVSNAHQQQVELDHQIGVANERNRR